MKLGKKILVIVLLASTAQTTIAQVAKPKFGKGIVIEGENYKMKAAFRFQNLFTNEWNVRNDDFNYVEGLKSNFMVRRARFKFSGWAYSPKVKYKMELGLSNKDLSGGDSPEYNNASRMILDAYIEYNFFQGFSVLAGQTKLPGNRERIISSANMQFVDRSRLNSKFTLDRDMGIMLKHKASLGEKMKIKSVYSLAQGAGRNVTAGNIGGGFSHTFKVEVLPFGNFTSKGDYTGGDLNREQTPKLAIATAYNINTNAVRERGQKGSFIIDGNGNYLGKTLNTLYADLMFKYKGFSLMGEFAQRVTDDGSPDVLDNNNTIVGTYYTGSALNIQAGYLLNSNYEFSGRYTIVTPEVATGNSSETEYGIALSKYVVGHKLKVQTDLGYRQISNTTAKDDKLFWRVQIDIHF
jgi:hypothetical protein